MDSWDETKRKIDAEFLWWDWWNHFGQYLTSATYSKSFLCTNKPYNDNGKQD